MSDSFRYLAIAFGVLFFIAHLAWMLYSLPFAQDRAKRLEYFGKVVPGFAGICIALAVWVQSPLLAVPLMIAGGFVLILGRAVYELIVFRGNAES
jgi:predicted membrane channel-forming protein YqfA (hemolysin III family)